VARRDAGLDPGEVDPDPFVQFSQWFADAVDAGQVEPEAMSLATADPAGDPSVRWVLLKSVDERGFVVYTNYRSDKGRDLAANPRAALGFRWTSLHRQVRASGRTEVLSSEESDAYFATRSRGSQLGAWASDQSAVIDGRAELDARLAEAVARFSGGEVPRPSWWGGFRVVPDMVEFWQGRADRLHDRVRYRRRAQEWVIERLAP
jgi:pyridoxamine 5'-phosphate oxidase